MISIQSPIQYLFEVSCCLVAFYLFYHWILRRETFFKFNRFYLLLTPIISLIIPCFQTGQIVTVQQQTPQNLEFIPQAIQEFQQTEMIFNEKINTVSAGIGFTWGNLILGIYLFVVAIFLIQLFRNLWAVRRMVNSNTIKKEGSYYQVILPNIQTPYSFFNYLFWNGKTEKETELMLEHEQVHIRQRHSIDIILIQILVAFFWFHPLVYLFRKAIKTTHEYLADQYVAQQFGRRKEYAALLLASATPQFSLLTSTFNSFVKNRLVMIYKKRTPAHQLWKLLTILPLLLALILLFSCDRVNSIPNDPVGKMVNQAEGISQEIFKKEVVPTGAKDFLDIEFAKHKESFDVLFELEKLNDDEYNVAVTIVLNDKAYIVSPFSKDTTYGHFYFTIPESKYLIPEKKLLEIPKSVEEFDEIINGPVRFVRVNTTYKRKVKLTSQEDFEVTGLVEFLLEPICIPYDVEFTISKKSGEMKIEKKRTFISSEYKM